MASKKSPSDAPTIENRRARHDYAISDTIEVGIVLVGTEVKTAREGRVSLAGGFVRVRDDTEELYLHDVSFAEFGPAGPRQHKTTRPRRLLAHKREIRKLKRQVAQKGVTLVPLKMYFKDGRLKLLVGVGRGKTRGDKRQTLVEREARRDIDRAMSRRR